jgi:hypothetical protein
MFEYLCSLQIENMLLTVACHPIKIIKLHRHPKSRVEGKERGSEATGFRSLLEERKVPILLVVCGRTCTPRL